MVGTFPLVSNLNTLYPFLHSILNIGIWVSGLNGHHGCNAVRVKKIIRGWDQKSIWLSKKITSTTSVGFEAVLSIIYIWFSMPVNHMDVGHGPWTRRIVSDFQYTCKNLLKFKSNSHIWSLWVPWNKILKPTLRTTNDT